MQNGSFGHVPPNANGIHCWTSRSQGVWAWAVSFYSDANGNVIPALSGGAAKYLKGSNFAGTKFVRP